MFPQAEEILKSLCALYSDEGWFDLVYTLKIQLAESQKCLQHIEEYIVSCLDLLSPYFNLTQELKQFYLEEIILLSTKIKEPGKISIVILHY